MVATMLTLAKRALLALLLLLSFGCATTDQIALATERGLEAGSMALDAAVDQEIIRCQSPDPAARARCIAPIERVSDGADAPLRAAVAALRAYWTAAAAGDKGAASRALLAAKTAIAGLPPEYFGGLPALVQKAVRP
jgi:hypothetical protein